MWEEEKVGTRVDPRGCKVSLINYIFISEGVGVGRKEAVDVSFSNHSLLRVDLQLRTRGERGKGVWRLNTLLLEDDWDSGFFRKEYEGWRILKNFFLVGGSQEQS